MTTLRLIVIWIATVAICSAEPTGGPTPENWGKFSGDPMVRLGGDGRSITLLEPFTYTDPRSTDWTTPKDYEADGASIPKVFWSVIGGPLEGKYRNASIIHDYECSRKKLPWRSVHRAFYEAMRCGGVPDPKAKIMYYAVYKFGPRWELNTNWLGAFGAVLFGQKAAMPTQRDVDEITRLIESKNPSLEEIEKLEWKKHILLESPK